MNSTDDELQKHNEENTEANGIAKSFFDIYGPEVLLFLNSQLF